jgi:hypothetical protein
LNTLSELKEEKIKETLEAINENQEKNQENLRKIIQEKNRGEDKNHQSEKEMLLPLQEEGEKSQKKILHTLLEFKFEYLENIENEKKLEEAREDSIDIREEFRAIHSENLMAIKRIMTDCHMEVVQPLISIQEGIERNLTEIPENTRNIIRKVRKIEKDLKEKEEKELEEMNTIAMLGTLNLVQTNEGRKDVETKIETGFNEIRTDIDELKLSVRELGLRVIEFGSTQKERDTKMKEILKDKERIKEEEETEIKPVKVPVYKTRKPPSESSSSSSSSDEERKEENVSPKRSLKSGRLIRPNLRTNELDRRKR